MPQPLYLQRQEHTQSNSLISIRGRNLVRPHRGRGTTSTAVGHGHRLWHGHVQLFLGLKHRDHIRKLGLGANLPLRVIGQHDLDLDAQHPLAHEDVADGVVDVLTLGLPGLDHVTVLELHALGTLGTQLARDHHFRTLGALLHHEAEDTIAGTADGQAAQQLVLEGLGLGLGTQAAGSHLIIRCLGGEWREWWGGGGRKDATRGH